LTYLIPGIKFRGMTISLDAPLRLPCGLSLGNRVAKSAMTEALGDERRLPSPALLRLYERWAPSGAGLLVTGNVGVCAAHPVRPRDVILGGEADLTGFRRWAEVARSGGAKVVMQLNHAGRQTPRFVNPRPLGPSEGNAVRTMRAFGAPRAATEAEIVELIGRFTEASARAEAAGFDGVQIHAAHGYLLNQFLAPDVNRRDDAWGGDVPRRARLLLDVVDAVRAAVSKGFAVMVKLNAADFLRGGFTEEEALQVVVLLEGRGVDLLEISGGRYESGASFGYATEGASPREAYFLSFARRARACFTAPLMLTGGLRTRGPMQAALDEGALDVVGIARPMALVPDYPRRLLTGAPLPKVAPRRLGVHALEGASELGWYSGQLARMARGQDPDPRASAWWSLLQYVGGDAWEALRRRPSPPPLLAGEAARALPCGRRS
jgi:2,4-dienoyl-CoA reductase-like NADH-dependent reductase (Old Yellow Enzyme family)